MLFIVMPPAFHKGTFQYVKVKNEGKKMQQQKIQCKIKINSRVVKIKILKIMCGTLTQCRQFYYQQFLQ